MKERKKKERKRKPGKKKERKKGLCCCLRDGVPGALGSVYLLSFYHNHTVIESHTAEGSKNIKAHFKHFEVPRGSRTVSSFLRQLKNN